VLILRTRVLGMQVIGFAGDRKALSFGSQKINLHQSGKEFEPKAQVPTPGSADLCFVTSIPITDAITHLASCGVTLLEGSGSANRRQGPHGIGVFSGPGRKFD
jgi:hypothetical protein